LRTKHRLLAQLAKRFAVAPLLIFWYPIISKGKKSKRSVLSSCVPPHLSAFEDPEVVDSLERVNFFRGGVYDRN
jgi:hypothetical protein